MIVIRNAVPDDAEVIADFNIRLAWESESKRLDPPTIDRGVRLALARPELCRYFLAEVDGVTLHEVPFRALQLACEGKCFPQSVVQLPPALLPALR